MPAGCISRCCHGGNKRWPCPGQRPTKCLARPALGNTCCGRYEHHARRLARSTAHSVKGERHCCRLYSGQASRLPCVGLRMVSPISIISVCNTVAGVNVMGLGPAVKTRHQLAFFSLCEAGVDFRVKRAILTVATIVNAMQRLYQCLWSSGLRLGTPLARYATVKPKPFLHSIQVCFRVLCKNRVSRRIQLFPGVIFVFKHLILKGFRSKVRYTPGE